MPNFYFKKLELCELFTKIYEIAVKYKTLEKGIVADRVKVVHGYQHGPCLLLFISFYNPFPLSVGGTGDLLLIGKIQHKDAIRLCHLQDSILLADLLWSLSALLAVIEQATLKQKPP